MDESGAMSPRDENTLRGFYLGDRIRQVNAPCPDRCAGWVRVGRYEVLCASIIGRSHQDAREIGQGKSFREDAVAIASLGPWLMLAMSDGVGSAEWSRYGAAACVEFVIRDTLRLLDYGDVRMEAHTNSLLDVGVLRGSEYSAPGEEMLYDLVSSASKEERPNATQAQLMAVLTNAYTQTHLRLRQFAEVSQLDPYAMACTLQTILLNTETGLMAAGYLGDGLITGAWSFAQRELVSHRSTGESDTVCPLVSSKWMQFFSVQALPETVGMTLSALHLMTDGVADDCMGAYTFAPWARKMAARYRSPVPIDARSRDLATTLQNESVSQDDLSLMLVFRTPSPVVEVSNTPKGNADVL